MIAQLTLGGYRRKQLKSIDDVLYGRMTYQCTDDPEHKFDTLHDAYMDAIDHINKQGAGA